MIIGGGLLYFILRSMKDFEGPSIYIFFSSDGYLTGDGRILEVVVGFFTDRFRDGLGDWFVSLGDIGFVNGDCENCVLSKLDYLVRAAFAFFS